jgi:hypothetical protein
MLTTTEVGVLDIPSSLGRQGAQSGRATLHPADPQPAGCKPVWVLGLSFVSGCFSVFLFLFLCVAACLCDFCFLALELRVHIAFFTIKLNDSP